MATNTNTNAGFREVKNTEGLVAKAAVSTVATGGKKTPAQMMNAVLNSDATQKMLAGMLKQEAGTFTASVLDLYNTDTLLQKCDPKQVFGECLKAASLKLPINKQLGFAWVIPYKKNGVDIPQFQLGYKGLIQLCMRTGAYKYINAGVVYEGELRKIDKLTGELDISGEKLSEEIVGYFGYIETINGFRHSLYMSKAEVTKHASRYSKSYKAGSAIWRDNFDEMATKTVLRNLLNKWGVMSVELVNALDDDRADAADSVIASGVNDGQPATDETVIAADYTEKPDGDQTDGFFGDFTGESEG